MTEAELVAAGWAELAQTTDSYPKWKSRGFPANTHWGKAKAYFDQVVGGVVVPDPDPVPVPSPATGFRFALGSTGDNSGSAVTGQALGAKLMRTYDTNITSTVATVQSMCSLFQSRGIEPYILYDTPSNFPTISTTNIAAHAAALGPGGTQAHATLPVTWFELGNEMFYNYKNASGFGAEWADEYTTGYLRCYNAIKAANPNVKVMFSADSDNAGQAKYDRIAQLMYQVDPLIHTKVDAWVMHHYGPITGGHTAKIVGMLKALESHGAPNTIPLIISEDSIPTDNGRTLTSTMGYPSNLTYAEAAPLKEQKLNDMRSHPVFGSRLIIWTHWAARDIAATGTQTDAYYYYGATTNTGAAKGALTTKITQLFGQYP